MGGKVLVLAESMMPFCKDWGACQRVYYYSLKLISEGYDVHVICRNSSENPAGTLDVKGIKVTTPDQPRSVSKGNSTKARIIRVIKSNALILKTMQKMYRFAYSEPNLFRGKESKNWAEQNKQFIKDYIVREGIDCVIISGPPFGMFYLADEIKEIGVKLVLDYRDPWNLWYEKYSLAEKHEKRAVESADFVIASTDSLAKALKEKYGKDDVYAVLNGYDVSSWENQQNDVQRGRSDKLVISYVGYVLVNTPPAFRDPRCFIKTACEFLNSKDDVVIKFIGVGDDLSTIKEEYKNKIEFRNRIPVEDALREVNNSDVALVIHTAKDSSGNYIVCGKLYDYLKSGKFVLSVGDNAKCNNELIDRYDLGIHCGNNKKAIMESLEYIYAKWKEGSLYVSVPDDAIRYSRDFQNSELVKLLKNIDV